MEEKEYAAGALICTDDLQGRSPQSDGDDGGSQGSWHLQVARGDGVAVALLRGGNEECARQRSAAESPPCAFGLGCPETAGAEEEGKGGRSAAFRKVLQLQTSRAESFGGKDSTLRTSVQCLAAFLLVAFSWRNPFAGPSPML